MQCKRKLRSFLPDKMLRNLYRTVSEDPKALLPRITPDLKLDCVDI
jgi:hypothetical protein